MPRRSYLTALVLLSTGLAGCVSPNSKTGSTGVQISQGTDSLRVEINGQLFTEYHFTGAARPYFYPVMGPGELPMTRNWPMTAGENEEHDHPHHRSLWYAHG